MDWEEAAFEDEERIREAAEEGPKFYKNPSVATVLSFLCTGLGQIYNGQIAKGVLLLCMYSVSVLLMFVTIGFITTPILWIWGMVDANDWAKRINLALAADRGQVLTKAEEEVMTEKKPASPSSLDSISQLERLADLRDRGALSEEEFQNHKAKILRA